MSVNDIPVSNQPGTPVKCVGSSFTEAQIRDENKVSATSTVNSAYFTEPCSRPPHFRCHVCNAPICASHGRKSGNPRTGYQVRACPKCRSRHKSSHPAMQPKAAT